MRRGAVVRVELPRPAGASGHEQVGIRPAIVVQDEHSAPNLSTVVIVPLTSKLHAVGFAGSFVISPTSSNGLSVKSVVLTHQLRAIDKHRILDVIGNVATEDMATLERNLRNLLHL